MSVIYQIAIFLFTTGIHLAAFFNSKAREWVKGRRSWRSTQANGFDEGTKVAWFHAASLGEFEQGRPVIEAFRKEHPSYKILLSFFSPSGYQQKKDYSGADAVVYLPADTPGNASEFIRIWKPQLAVFIKYEFWFNYLAELKRNNIPIVFISALFRKKQMFFQWYGGWFRKKLRMADHFFLQDEPSGTLLESIGIKQYTISGDTRFDRVADILSEKKGNKDIEAWCRGSRVLLAGSTWSPDEAVLSNITANFPDLKMIIAPHEVKEERIQQIRNTLKGNAARYTLDEPGSWSDKNILIIDTVGLLSLIYRYADIAYIGGGFGSGLHNIQEPAVNGMPVIYGPKYQKFREAVELLALGGTFSVRNEDELIHTVKSLLEDEDKLNAACKITKQYMIDNTGATAKIMTGLTGLL